MLHQNVLSLVLLSISNLPDDVVFVKIVLSPSFKVIPPKIKESKLKRYLLLGRYNPAETFDMLFYDLFQNLELSFKNKMKSEFSKGEIKLAPTLNKSYSKAKFVACSFRFKRGISFSPAITIIKIF